MDEALDANSQVVTAVAFTGDGLLVTSAHVVDGVRGGGVISAEGEEAPFDVV